VVVEKPLAIGRYEITFDDWERCVSAGGCSISRAMTVEDRSAAGYRVVQ
jgi:formylglycine-generating enzyme required for sulfatase activity